MPPVKGSSKKKTRGKARAKPRGRKKQLTLLERVRQGIADLWTGLLSFMAVGLAALALIAVIMLFAGGYFWNIRERVETLASRTAQAFGFSVSRVSLVGSPNLSDRDVMRALEAGEQGSVLGASLFHVNTKKARAQIEDLGWVEAAAIQRLWPDTVHISVIEREPAAIWQSPNGSYHLIDRHGAQITQVSPVSYTHLPVIAGSKDPESALPLLGGLIDRPTLLDRVAVIMSVNDRRFNLRFRNDFTVMLPEGDDMDLLDRLEGLGAGTDKLAENLDYIDLRDPEWAYVKPKGS